MFEVSASLGDLTQPKKHSVKQKGKVHFGVEYYPTIPDKKLKPVKKPTRDMDVFSSSEDVTNVALNDMIDYRELSWFGKD